MRENFSFQYLFKELCSLEEEENISYISMLGTNNYVVKKGIKKATSILN